jgi:hypothetical protein
LNPSQSDDEESPRSKETKENLPLAYLFFRAHNLLCVISLALIAFAQALPLPHHLPLIIRELTHFYVLLASSVGIVVELDLSEWFITNMVPLLEKWFLRGLFYVFLGLFALEQSIFSHPPPDDDDMDGRTSESFFHLFGAGVSSMILWIASMGLFASGALYIVMGGLFMQGLKKRSEDDYEKRMEDMLSVVDDEEDEE